MDSSYPPLAAARSALEALADTALPPHCACCAAAGALICPQCQELIEPAAGGTGRTRCRHCWLPSPSPVCQDCVSRPLPLRELRAGFVYDGPVRAAVLTLKHQGVQGIARLLVELAGSLQTASDIDVIVPIPIPLLRRRRRGGNQAAFIAQALSERIGLPMDESILRRRGWWGPRQAQAQSRADRHRIVRGAFAADSALADGRGILLVDDVATTMATLNEAARVLREAGASAVDAWTVARAQ